MSRDRRRAFRLFNHVLTGGRRGGGEGVGEASREEDERGEGGRGWRGRWKGRGERGLGGIVKEGGWRRVAVMIEAEVRCRRLV